MSSLSKNSTNSSSSGDTEGDEQLRRGPWTPEEDTLLVHYIACHGEGRWNLLAKRAGLRRTGKSCRLRWLNYLNPDVKRGNLTPQEQLLILELHSKWGNRWSKIAEHLPGRTDNEIKNYWRTRVQKQARHLKVDVNSSAFQAIIRRLWMPRLLQKIEGSSSSVISDMLLAQNPTRVSDDNLPLPIAPPPPPPPSLPLLPQVSGHNHNNSSDSEHGSNSCISSTESMNNMSQASQLSSTSSFHATGNSSTFVKEGSYVNSSCYNMGTMDLDTMAVPVGYGNPPTGDCHMEEGDWVGYDFGDNMWSMDEFMAI